MLQAIKPDAMILCINPFDTIEYIRQTILAAEALTDGKVIALVCFPYDIDENWQKMPGKRVKLSFEKITNMKEETRATIGLKMYMLDDPTDQSNLMEDIISYFT